MSHLIILCCRQSSGDSIWTLLFVAFFSVVVSILGNWIVIRYNNIKKIKDEITGTCSKLILLNVKVYKFTALSWYHHELAKANSHLDSKLLKLLEGEERKFRDKFIDAEDDKQFQFIKLVHLNYKLSSYKSEKNLANKINIEINKPNKDKETYTFITKLIEECTKNKNVDSLHTDINKFVINEGNGKPLKDILTLFKFNLKTSTE